jgi:chromosome partitioning protein
MTHCGWNRQAAFTPDRSTQAYLSQVVAIAREHADLFTSENPIECIHLLDDFHSAGRISGSRRIPLANMEIGETYTVEGQKLEVNLSLTRYKQELKSMAASI